MVTTSRALLLTDVVDSTRVVQEFGDEAFAPLWAAHDRAARDLLPLWQGREIDKTDGLLLLFDSVADAVGYALAYHRALTGLKLPFKARAGVHFGPVTLRANAAADIALGAKPIEVEGLAKVIAARVMAVALGGQTLLTSEALPGLGTVSMRLQSHGHWRLKGLPDPLELFEVGDDDAPFLPPPDDAKAYRVVRQGDLWQPVRDIHHTLPAERDTFVGRTQPLLEMSRRLHAGARLLSVLGLGGTGKTRLVTRFAWSWLGEYPGGVWFCDLSQARGLDGIAFAVAQGLEVPLGGGDSVAQLGHAIAGRGRCLVVLDNFEQVARHAKETLGRWLDRAADACFVVTTREVLGLAGEEVLALAPLTPDDAAALFVQRARAAKPDFHPTAEDTEAIEPLVGLLEGLPLAIELAAARMRVMPPRTLLTRMRERFKLLVSSGGRIDRQATLRTVFDWSWDLLPPAEKAALAQLSVFEGGLTLEAAEAVLDLSGHQDAPWPVDALQSLLQKSFVYSGADARFGLLASVQEYAAEHLRTATRYAGSGSVAELAAQVRHGAFFAAMDEARATAGASVELDNFAAACRRAVARADAAMATSLLERAWAGLRLRGPFRVGCELASLVLDVPALGAQAAARVHWVAGNALTCCARDAEAYPHFEAALSLALDTGTRAVAARALRCLGDLDVHAGRIEEARMRFESAMVHAQDLQDRRTECDVHNGLGNLEEQLGRLDLATRHYETALAIARSVGDRHREGNILGNLGLVSIDRGLMDQALARLEAALAAARETGNLKLAGNTLCNRGSVFQLLGRLAEAQAQLGEALRTARSLGHAELESIVLCNLAMVLESRADAGAARMHFEAAVELARTLGDRRREGEFLGYLGLLHARQGQNQEARACLDAAQTLLHSAADRLGLGILQCSRAEAAHLAGDALAGREALAAARAIGAEVGAGADSEIGLAIARVASLPEPVQPKPAASGASAHGFSYGS